MTSVAMVTEQQTSPASNFAMERAVFLLIVAVISVAEGRVICHHDSYTMRGQYCYRYVLATATYSQATRRCERDGWESSLLYITSAEEDAYVWNEMFVGQGREEFWLGLDDQINEGDFRWSYNESRPIYTNYSIAFREKNNDNFDCVKFTENGWQIQENFCENSGMSFVCKAAVCESSDGVICDEVSVTPNDGGGLSAGAIAAIIIVIIILISVIVVVIVLVLLWKFKNDVFRLYICPCMGRGSKQAMMSLQQENQRLRQELNQLKMNSSSRFSQGHFGRDSVSGVPDGMGGMLPTIKPGGGGGFLSSDPFSPSSPAQPPPLFLQRGISRVTPMTPTGGPFLSSTSPTPPSVFTAQSHRVSRSLKPGGGIAVGSVSLPPLKESKKEEVASISSGEDEEEDEEGKHSPAAAERAVEPQEKVTPPNSDEVKGHVAAEGQSSEITSDEISPENS